MTTPPTRLVDAASYRIPSLGYRILAGGLRLVPLLVVLVGLPVAVLTFLSAHGIALPVSILTVEVAGILISVLSTVRYVLRPTRAYGPASLATSAVTVGYLIVLWEQSTYRLAVPGTSATISVGYGLLIELLLLAAAFGLAASLVTTVEDFRSPGERLPFDFPP